ncbi:hypothetical protein FRB95_013934 [Tulasnella sp. JGI-2019a]|nr:hypothetical protein FRB93_010882 [Tulasnella sp. JGI-2019a]KAG9022947.1 hypothetical protein FRB95_013934 [Tulasnella sp. JGI-2019a]
MSRGRSPNWSSSSSRLAYTSKRDSSHRISSSVVAIDPIPQMHRSKHYVFACPPLMGHIRPMTHFACNLLKIHRTMHITFITHVAYVAVINTESARHSSQHNGLSERLHILPAGKDKGGSDSLDIASEIIPCLMEMVADFPAVYSSLLKCEASEFDPSQKTFSMSPTLVLADSALAGPISLSKVAVETKLGINRRIPFITQNVTPPCFIIRMANIFSDTKRLSDDPCRSGYLKLRDASTGIQGDQRKAWEEIHDLNSPNALVRVPGMPDIYAYELCPQHAAEQYPANMLEILPSANQKVLDQLEGHILPYDATLNGKDAEALNLLCGRQKGATYLVGPQFTEDFWTGEYFKESSPELVKGTSFELVQGFLDRTQARFGARSVLYISFGTLTFPRKTSHLVAFFETLLSMSPPIPFIFSRNLKYIKLPDGLTRRLDERMKEDLALIVGWAPQQTVLLHPALSFFLSHCGSGSVHEAIVAGIPLILWPIAAIYIRHTDSQAPSSI